MGLPDSCATAKALDLGNGKVTLTGDTTRANDNTRLYCSLPGTKSNDLVWIVTIEERRRLVATVTPTLGSAFRPVLSLRTVCDSMDSKLSVGCAYPVVGATSRLSIDALDQGTYYLWVEGEDASSGAFTLDVQLEVPPLSDSCAGPRLISIVSDNSEEILGDTRGLQDDAAGSCGGSQAPDAVYAVRLIGPRRLRIDVEGLSSGFQPVLYARTACNSGTAETQVGCVSTTTVSSLDIPHVKGTLFIFVDGQSATSAGAYRLRITPFDPVPAPTNDVCAQPTAIPMPTMALGVVNQQGDTTSAANDALGCNASGPDLVYQFTLPVARQVLARVTPLAGSGLRPAVYLRPAMKCESEATVDQVGCQVAASPGAAATTVVPTLPAGVWYLWVDGQQGSGGPFDLKLEFAEPPPAPSNDACPGSTLLDLTTGVVNKQGTTLGAKSDKVSACTLPTNQPTPDVVYEVSLPMQQSLSIDLRATLGSALQPVATLRGSGCESVAANVELACAWGDPQLPERAVYTLPSLDAGTYYLWVSGDNDSQGPFSLKLSTGPAISPPSNDHCTAAIPSLIPNVFVDGDTRAASDSAQATGCGLPAGADGSGGRDVAFRFSTVGAAATVTLSVYPFPVEGQLFRPVIYVRPGGCTSSLSKGCAVAASYGGVVALTLNNLPAGTYTAWVDGAGQSSGKFAIRMY